MGKKYKKYYLLPEHVDELPYMIENEQDPDGSLIEILVEDSNGEVTISKEDNHLKDIVEIQIRFKGDNHCKSFVEIDELIISNNYIVFKQEYKSTEEGTVINLDNVLFYTLIEYTGTDEK